MWIEFVLSLYYSFSNILCSLFCANRKTWKVVEVNQPKLSILSNNHITSVDGNIYFLCNEIGIIFDTLCIKGKPFFLSIHFLQSKLGVSSTSIIPMEEVCALYTIELDKVSLQMLLNNPEIDIAFLQLLKCSVEVFLGGTKNNVVGTCGASITILQPYRWTNVILIASRTDEDIAFLSYHEFGLRNARLHHVGSHSSLVGASEDASDGIDELCLCVFISRLLK